MCSGVSKGPDFRLSELRQSHVQGTCPRVALGLVTAGNRGGALPPALGHSCLPEPWSLPEIPLLHRGVKDLGRSRTGAVALLRARCEQRLMARTVVGLSAGVWPEGMFSAMGIKDSLYSETFPS